MRFGEISTVVVDLTDRAGEEAAEGEEEATDILGRELDIFIKI